MPLEGQIKVNKRRFEKFYGIDFSNFNFEEYFKIIDKNNKIQRKLRKLFVLNFVNKIKNIK